MNEKIFEQYNEFIQKEFEKNVDYIRTKEDYEATINKGRRDFEESLFEGHTIKEALIKSIDNYGIDDLLDQALVICDMYLPYSLIELMHKLLDFKGISQKIDQKGMPEADRATLINSFLGMHEKEEVIDYLINIVVTEESDLLKEEAINVLFKTNGQVVYDKINAFFEANGINDDLLGLLVKLDKSFLKDKDLLILLKERFLTTEDKALLAEIMADLNDGRAVTFLRGYLNKNKFKLSQSEIVDICSAISRMGGKTDDFIKPQNFMN